MKFFFQIFKPVDEYEPLAIYNPAHSPQVCR